MPGFEELYGYYNENNARWRTIDKLSSSIHTAIANLGCVAHERGTEEALVLAKAMQLELRRACGALDDIIAEEEGS